MKTGCLKAIHECIRTNHRLILVVILNAIFVTACGPAFQSKDNAKSVPGDYVYHDPRTGDPVVMTTAEQRVSPKLAQHQNVEIKDPVIQILNDRTVIVTVNKISKNKAEHVVLQGKFNESLWALLTDTEPVAGLSRLKGQAQCTGGDTARPNCSELFIELYFLENGAKNSRQFTVYDNSLKTNGANSKPEKSNYPEPTPKSSELGHLIPEPVITNTPTETVPKTDEEPQTQTEHYVMPKFDEKNYGDIEDTKTTPEVAIEPTAPSFFSRVALDGGGRSYHSASSGRIVDGPSTLIPPLGAGYHRSPSTRAVKSFSTGYAASFFETAAREFKSKYPNCGDVIVGNASNEKGGMLFFDHNINGQSHALSHQNGLDLDIAYVQQPDLVTILAGAQIRKDVNLSCSYNWLKLIANAERVDHVMFVSGVLVHRSIFNALCRYKKVKKLNSTEDAEVEKILIPREFDHDDHMHLRLYCSPEHSECRDDTFKYPGC